MCGYTIIKKGSTIENKHQLIKHRGLEHTTKSYDLFNVDFYSLALSSKNSNYIQPVVSGNYSFVFNGEIFNYKSLNRKCKSDLEYLSKLFYEFKYDQDRIYKESLKWDGFWSISIIKNSSVYFFTDPLGKKQLYYSEMGISSEIKPLIENNSKYDYNENYFLKSRSSFQFISRAIPDQMYHYNFSFKSASVYKKRKYFDEIKYINSSKIYDLLELAVLERIENKIDGISLLLSSGIDSNIIKYYLDKHGIKTEFVSFKSNEFNLISNHINKVAEIDVTNDSLNTIVKAYEHGLDYGSLIPNYFLFKECSNHVVLTGDGADELFGGYNRSKENDTFNYDVFSEIPYYHNIRIDRMSMIHTKEARSPFMSHKLVKFASLLKREERTGKKILKDLFKNKIPDYCFNEKQPLRLNNDKEYNKQLIKSTFNNLKF